MVNILSGGLHAAQISSFKIFSSWRMDSILSPRRFMRSTRVHLHARLVLEARGYSVTGVADEGGWGPLLPSNETALQIVTEAIERAGYRPGEHFSIALDVAASHFEKTESITCHGEPNVEQRASDRVLEELDRKYPIASIEDGLEQDDWEGWRD